MTSIFPPVFSHSAADIAAWRSYADFHLRLSSILWSPASIIRPYGQINLGSADDWGDLLWRYDGHTDWHANNVIDDVEEISSHHLSMPGFYVNPTYDMRRAEDLQVALTQRGYIPQHRVHWLALKNLAKTQIIIPESLDIGDAHDAKEFICVQRESFPDYDFEPACRRYADMKNNPIRIRFIVLRDRHSREPLAAGGVAWEGDFAYLFALGVRTAQRRQGFARLMVDWRLNELAKVGVKQVVTGVMAGNDASYALQLQKGYRPFASAECWLKSN